MSNYYTLKLYRASYANKESSSIFHINFTPKADLSPPIISCTGPRCPRGSDKPFPPIVGESWTLECFYPHFGHSCVGGLVWNYPASAQDRIEKFALEIDLDTYRCSKQLVIRELKKSDGENGAYSCHKVQKGQHGMPTCYNEMPYIRETETEVYIGEPHFSGSSGENTHELSLKHRGKYL